MSVVLAFDTSGTIGSVALVRNGDPSPLSLSEVIGEGMRHGVDLFPAIERVLRSAGLGAREIDVVAVGTGPGSYTGLRVGVTAARALAYACGARLMGVPSCDAWAEAAAPSLSHDGGATDTLAVVLDAKVKAVYIALYGWDAESQRFARTFGPELLLPAEAAAKIPAGARVIGDGIAPYAEQFAGHTPEQTPNRADALHVAALAGVRDDRGERDLIEDVVPLYLREFRPTTPKTMTPQSPRIPDEKESRNG